MIFLSFPKGCEPSQAIPEKIQKWLEMENLKFNKVVGEGARNTLFNYHVTLPSGTSINVFQPSNKKDSICVSTALIFGDAFNKKFNQKTNIELTEIFSEMRFKLASVDVEFNFENGELPKRLVIYHPIYFDAISKDRFFKAISTVYKAFNLANWVLKQSV